MKHLLLIFAMLFLFSCDNKPQLIKPFMVIKIEPATYKQYYEIYYFQDKNGKKFHSYDKIGTYQLGEIIK